MESHPQHLKLIEMVMLQEDKYVNSQGIMFLITPRYEYMNAQGIMQQKKVSNEPFCEGNNERSQGCKRKDVGGSIVLTYRAMD